ncbi:GNAT family N-acetyltransferase [Pseudonocardia hydrocarbonoxydans]|uniref:N-acetyltransferase domain-containing protein n=1 Tax=Pseudonocardia hydrocarbonoxydans TaxID=76726 RepID=A0A4Y3WSP2_9PSEU|nr:GNAT family N-acetyltransferase [Pseudonocardia hydrocarbonoxydans]GEC21321.1 hypothetical protein PHY01_36040 [Pseudonocardia hydrocarbonoxydans]
MTDGREDMLRDGRRVTLRAVQPADAALLAAGFARLSEESRFRRFLSPLRRLTPRQLEFLTRVDHRDHEAIGAVAVEGGVETGVGVARFVRSAVRPHEADLALTVSDEWQGRGLGGLLLRRLARRAREEGVTRFTADVLAANGAVLHLLRSLGPTTTARDGTQLTVTVELVPVPEERAGRTVPAAS